MASIRDKLLRFYRKHVLHLYALGLQAFWRVKVNAIFDAQFYSREYPDVVRSGADPTGHFLLYGAREKRQPHRFFDTAYYLAMNPDVERKKINPALHFLRYGWKEGRRPNPLFDMDWYREHNAALPAGVNPFLDYLRRTAAGQNPQQGPGLSEFVRAEEQAKSRSRAAAVIDVVIPVYRGIAQTRRCLESILNARCENRPAVVLVNDASPEPELAEYVRQAAALHGFTLLENERSLGFAGAVNRALALHPERDAVLLNSDTEVAGNWLDRLASAAYSGPRVGTATPFSNNAGICSYPRPGRDNPLPEGSSASELDRVFQRVNAGRTVALPTAVGFCMYIRGECLRETGLFDEVAFPRGYGEENDFCLRAAALGWHHVLAADVFVYHEGGVSFSADRDKLCAKGAAILQRRHPGWNRLVTRHVLQDPAAAYRFRVTAHRLAHSGRPVILLVSHTRGGGVAHYIELLCKAIRGTAEVLQITPFASGAVLLESLTGGHELSIVADPVGDYERLLSVLRLCRVQRIHIQHLIGHTLDFKRLVRDLGVPFDFTIHDYFTICPQVNLTDASGRYCGEPEEEGCNRCLAERPCWPKRDIGEWRRENAWLIKDAARCIAPSFDAEQRFKRRFPGVQIVTARHPEYLPVRDGRQAQPLTPDEPLHIAVLGAVLRHKGVERLRACARQAQVSRLPLRYTVIGYTEKTSPGGQARIEETGAYEAAALTSLLLKFNPHLVWFPGQMVETYSFTLSAALAVGLPVVVPDLGAMRERVAGRSWSWVVPWDLSPEQMTELFLDIRERNFLTGHAPAPPGGIVRSEHGDFYKAHYVDFAPVTSPFDS